MLSFFDEKGWPRLRVGFSPSGLTGLIMSDAQKHEKLSLLVDAKDETPRLHLSNGTLLGPSIYLSIDDRGEPHMAISKVGGGQISMGLDDQAEPNLTLSESDNSPISTCIRTRAALTCCWEETAR